MDDDSVERSQDQNSTVRTDERTGRRRRRRRRVLTVLGIALALVLISGAGIAYYARSVEQAITQNLRHDAQLPADSDRPAPAQGRSADVDGDGDVDGDDVDPAAEPAGRPPMTVVLMGSDTRPGDGGRSDSLMLAHLSGDRQTAYLISFPRDMWVEIPGHGEAKINAAYAFGGTPLAVQTMESLLDTRMDHLAVVDFDGFVGLTDDIGGVVVDNEHAFSARGEDFATGPVELSGERALVFVRERFALPAGDFDRAENQRKVVQAILAKGLSREVISNPRQFTAFVSGIARHTSVDAGLTDAVVRDTALSLRLNGRSDIVTLQAPIEGLGTSADGQSIDIVDFDQLDELGRALATDTMAEYVAAHPGD